MMTASACLSTSVTKSFTPLLSTCTFSTSSEARLMTAPAARAALMAMLSIGWRDWDMGVSNGWTCGAPHGAPARAEEGRQRRKSGAMPGGGRDGRRRDNAGNPYSIRPGRAKSRARRAGAPGALQFLTDSTRFILVDTSHPGNVGAAARAMKVMGFADLVLVTPRFADVLAQPDAIAMASGATDILERARIVATLDEALDGTTFACATAMTPRDFGPPTRAPRERLRRTRARPTTASPSCSAASASGCPTSTSTPATCASASRRSPSTAR